MCHNNSAVSPSDSNLLGLIKTAEKTLKKLDVGIKLGYAVNHKTTTNMNFKWNTLLTSIFIMVL